MEETAGFKFLGLSPAVPWKRLVTSTSRYPIRYMGVFCQALCSFQGSWY